MCRSSAVFASSSITGPTSVSARAGSPTRNSIIAPASISSTRGAASSCTRRMRSAEQRWPALLKADASTSVTTCSGSAEESITIAFRPPVSAMNGTMGPSRAASARLMASAVSNDPVKATPATRGWRTSAAPTVSPVPATTRSASSRHARFVQERRGARGHEGCLFRRFCHHRVSRRERRAHLAREDRERKVPRADAREHAAAGQLEPVRFARRSGQLQRSGEIRARLRRVIAQKVGRFPHFAGGVGQALAGFAHEERNQLVCGIFHRVGRPFEYRGALGRRGFVPAAPGGGGRCDGGMHVLRRCLHARCRRCACGRRAH